MQSKEALSYTLPNTPMMQQYAAIKKEAGDAILFYRLGDFYEMFGEDAIKVADLLGLTLTGRGKDKERVPMCGVPHHAAERYLVSLVQHGFKVAIAEQVEEASASKGLTKRAITQVVSPATILNEGALDAEKNNFLMAVCTKNEAFFAVILDCSTGMCVAHKDLSAKALQELILRFEIKEVLIDQKQAFLDLDEALALEGVLFQDMICVSYGQAEQSCCEQFNLVDLSVFKLEGEHALCMALAGLIRYIKTVNPKVLGMLKRIDVVNTNSTCRIHANSVKQLELVLGAENTKHFSLFATLNQCKTSMGARCLRAWCLEPLYDQAAIEARLDVVSLFVDDYLKKEQIRSHLAVLIDMERTASRLLGLHRNPKELRALAASLQHVFGFIGLLSELSTPLLDEMKAMLQAFQEPTKPLACFSDAVLKAFEEDVAALFTYPGLVEDGVSDELDALRDSLKDIKEYMRTVEQVERDKTGIKTLKLGYNRVFGYYLDVSNAASKMVPEHYICKQTLSHAKRYITPELKEKERIVLSAQEQELEIEKGIYDALIAQLKGCLEPIQHLAKRVAQLDVLVNFAHLSVERNYTRAHFVSEAKSLQVIDARHPVVEQEGRFIPNTIRMDENQYFYVITGPNMAGKSTVMRQVALLVVMAQMGCFVPAKAAKLCLVDAIFTRIGAMDHLAKGQSTFMVEMLETAHILHQASSESLVILDEIGRGTSTYDGLSIAAAVSQHLANTIGARCLFATHYHELAQLAKNFKGTKMMQMAIQKEQEKLIFTYKLQEGQASQSFGVEVANMAGLPQEVISQANHYLEKFEAESVLKPKLSAQQLALF